MRAIRAISAMPRRAAALCRHLAALSARIGAIGAIGAVAAMTPSSAGAASPTAAVPGVADAITVADLWIREQIAYHGVPGVAIAVVHGSEIVWSAGYGSSDLATGAPVTPQTRFRLGSVSKLFTATAVMILRDEGKLRLEDPVDKHLPWFAVKNPFADRPAITVEQLLTHTSGLPREAPLPYWTTHDFPGREALRASLGGISLLARPGETYRYSNLGVSLLGEIVAAVSGESWAAFVDRRILSPLGMAASQAEPTDFSGLARAYLRKRPDGSRGTAVHYPTRAIAPASSVVSTAEDLARFAAFHLAAVELAAMELDTSARAATSPTAPLAATTRREMQRARFVYPGWNGGRGLGFAVSRRDGRTFPSHGGWIGGHRADLILDPSRGVAVVALTNADDASPALFSRKVLDIVGSALARTTTKAPVAALPDPAWQRYVGSYTDPWEWEYEVLILDGGLVLYGHDYPPDDDPEGSMDRLTPIGPSAFRMEDGESVVFESDDSGKVTRLRRRSEILTPKRAGDAGIVGRVDEVVN